MRVVGGLSWVVGLGAAALVVGLTWPPAPAPAEGDGAAVPRDLAAYSHLTGSVSSSPPGPAVALFQHGFGVELMDFPQAVVLGAGGDSYRRVDVAEDRAGAETQGDPAPMLLSPDGRYVAVGDHDTAGPDVALVDLTTGETSTYDLPRGRSVIPVAFSADVGRLALLVSDEPTNPYSGGRIRGDVAVLDLDAGSTDVLDLGGSAAGAAFSPDGTELAVERAAPRELSVTTFADDSERTLALDGVLAGPNAWSPDGRLLAVTTVDASAAMPGVDDPGVPTGLAFVDATGAGAEVPGPVPLPVSAPGRVLAWNGDDEVVMLLSADADAATLSDVPLDGSEPRTLVRIHDLGSYGVGRFQLAADAGGRLEVVEPSTIDRGPWPLALRLSASVLAGLLAWLLAAVAVRIGRRVSRRRA